MSNTDSLESIQIPDTASQGYFVHARHGDEHLMTPGPGSFYVELETALALGIAWVNERHAIDPATMRVSHVRARNGQIVAIALRFRGTHHCGVVVIRSDVRLPPL